jgi:hypothetical protein
MITFVIAKAKLPSDADWQQILADADELLKAARGLWSRRSDFDTATFWFRDERDALLFKMYFSSLLTTYEEELERKMTPLFRFIDHYAQTRTHLVATVGEKEADRRLAPQRAILDEIRAEAETLRATRTR